MKNGDNAILDKEKERKGRQRGLNNVQIDRRKEKSDRMKERKKIVEYRTMSVA